VTDAPELIDDESTQIDGVDGRWIAFAIWGAVLLALLVTSYAGIVGPTSNIDLTLLTLERYQDLSSPEKGGLDTDLIAWVSLAITAAIALGILLLWALFGRATSALLSGLADEDGEDQPARAWVGGGNRSMLGDLLMWGGLVWALLIARPVLVRALRLLTN
jgi:hypothetical protein